MAGWRSASGGNQGTAARASPVRLGTATDWLIAGLLFLLCAIGMAVIAAGEGTLPGDVALTLALQRPTSEEIDAIARAVSFAGDDFPAMVVLALVGVAGLVYVGRPDLALFLGGAAALRAVGPVLKFVINSPRPSIETVMVVVQADGLGFPSGHALGAALFYGAIAVIAPQVAQNRLVASGIQVAAFAMMGAIALSRVRLGVHWPTDVAGGLLYGLSLVCLMRSAMLTWREGRLRT